MPDSRSYLQTFFDEKALEDRVYHVASPSGETINLIPTSAVIAAILAAPIPEQDHIAGLIRRLDFVNGDVHHLLEHLAAALAVDL